MTTQTSHLHLTQTRQIVTEFLNLFPIRPFDVQLPDGTIIPPSPPDQPPPFTFVLNRPSALRRMFFPPSELAMGEGYIFGDFDIKGDMVAAFSFANQLQKHLSLSKLLRVGKKLIQLERNNPQRPPKPNGFTAYKAQGKYLTPERDKRAVQFHHDLSNDFFKLWLDEHMAYSCACFAHDHEDLESAQKRKFDYVCRKLNLKSGERFLDIGCGWGGLLIHAAANYGVQATGISLSKAQTKEALARIEAAGLSDRCHIHITHYETYQSDHLFDKIASIGMFEYIGPRRLESFFRKCLSLLKPGSLFLLQGASAQGSYVHSQRGIMDLLGRGRHAFYQKYIFPDSELVDISKISTLAEKAGFEIRDIENLREHYALTLHHWLQRLEKHQDAAIAEVGEAAYRCWHLLTAYTKYFMEKGILAEFQTLLGKPGPGGHLDLSLKRPAS